jgi:hypothetical protein
LPKPIENDGFLSALAYSYEDDDEKVLDFLLQEKSDPIANAELAYRVGLGMIPSKT